MGKLSELNKKRGDTKKLTLPVFIFFFLGIIKKQNELDNNLCLKYNGKRKLFKKNKNLSGGALMKRGLWLLISLVLALSLTLYSCGGGGGGGSSSTSSSGTTKTLTGRSALSLILPTTTTSGTRSISRSNTDPNANAILGQVSVYVDGNKDNLFTNNPPDQVITLPISSNGTVPPVSIPVFSTGGTKIKVVVNLNGYAPYEKIFTVYNNSSNTINLKSALKHVLKTTVPIIRNNRGTNQLLVIGTEKTSQGLKPFAKFISPTRANSVTIKPSNVKNEVVIPTSSIPDNVSQLNVSMAEFGNNPSDFQSFPGEFKGTGYPQTRGSDDEVQLKSIAFMYLNITDQDGNKVNFKEGKGSIKGIQCSNFIITIDVPKNQIKYLKDDETGNGKYDVPVWAYNPETGLWDYVTEGQLYYNDNSSPVADNATLDNSTSYYVQACVPPNWTYMNLDYGLWAGEKPVDVKLCVKATDQNGNPVSNIFVYASGKGDTGNTMVYSSTDSSGTAKLTLPVPYGKIDSLKNSYSYTWSGKIVDWRSMNIQPDITKGQGDCDYELNFTVNNPFTAKIEVKLEDKNGNPLTYRFATVYELDNSTWTPYDSLVSDDNGTFIFSVKPNVEYKINALDQTVYADVNYTKDDNESFDNGTFAKVIIKQKVENHPPTVDISTDQKNKKLYVYISAYDIDQDSLALESATIDNASIKDKCKVFDSIPSNGYGFWICKVSTESYTSGSHYVKAKVSDGKVTSDNSTSFTISTNQPPQVYGIDVTDENGNYVNTSALNVNTTYTFTAYAWDPDGDNLTYTFTFRLNGQAINNCTDLNTNQCDYEFTNDGNYNIKVVVSDPYNNTASYTISVHVGAAKPVISSVGADKYLLNPYSDTINVFAYASAPGANLTTGNFVWSVDGDNVTVDNASYRDGEYTGSLTLTFDNQSKAEHTIKLTVTNGDQKASSSFTVWTDRPPIFKTPLPDNVTLNQGDVYTFEVYAEDPDFQTVQYYWRIKCNNGGWVNAGSNDSTLTYEFDDNGTCEVQAIASDGILQTTSTCKVYVKASASVPEVGQAMYRFINNPNDDNYNTLLSAIDQLPDSKTAHLWRAIGELLKFYQDNKDTLNALGLTISDLDNSSFEGSTFAYNLLTQSNYGQETEGLIESAEDVLDNAYNELQQAEGINTAITVGPETVYFDTLDIKIMELIDRMAKAICLYSSLVNIDNVQNWKVHISENTVADIRDLIKERNVTTEEWAEFFNNNKDILKYADTTKLSDLKDAVSNINDLYDNIISQFDNMTKEQLYQRHNHAFELASEAELKYADAFKTTLNDIVEAMDDAKQDIEVPSLYFKGEFGVIDGGNGYYYPVELYSLYMNTYKPNNNPTIYDLISGNKTPRDLLISAFNPQSEEPYTYDNSTLLFDNLTLPRWNALIPEYKLPTANINVKDNSSSDWDNVPVFFQKDNLTIKIATDETNFYVYAEGPKDVINSNDSLNGIDFGFYLWPYKTSWGEEYPVHSIDFYITDQRVSIYPDNTTTEYETLNIGGTTLAVEASFPLNYVVVKKMANVFTINIGIWWIEKKYKFVY